MKKTKAKNKNCRGFALLEIIVSVSLFVVIIILVNSIFLSSQNSYRANSNMAELSQNARVSLDRMSREIRQAVDVITSLPASKTDPAVEQIFFQDGHDISRITYILYYLDGSNLMKQIKAYYFDSDPSTYVTHDALDYGGYPPDELILEDRIIGEYFSGIKFWSSNGTISIELNLLKNKNSLNVETAVGSRNQ